MSPISEPGAPYEHQHVRHQGDREPGLETDAELSVEFLGLFVKGLKG